MAVQILVGDCRERLRELPDASVNCCVTSPPYFGLRDYGVEGQMGLESTPDEFVVGMVEVFREVRRVLRDDGTLWLNIGDTHKNKQLLGIPWRLALAMQADGWILRQEIIWNKTNAAPENVNDRCTDAHEHLFLLSKRARYYFDAKAIAEKAVSPTPRIVEGDEPSRHGLAGARASGVKKMGGGEYRNKRSVWDIASSMFSAGHFATFPADLVKPCILAGCPVGGTVLDPFFGAGTTGLVADRWNLDCIGIELNPEYAEIARKRLCNDGGMFSEVKAA
jgi:DNA modification methylase